MILKELEEKGVVKFASTKSSDKMLCNCLCDVIFLKKLVDEQGDNSPGLDLCEDLCGELVNETPLDDHASPACVRVVGHIAPICAVSKANERIGVRYL